MQNSDTIDAINSEIARLEAQAITAWIMKDLPAMVILDSLNMVWDIYDD